MINVICSKDMVYSFFRHFDTVKDAQGKYAILNGWYLVTVYFNNFV